MEVCGERKKRPGVLTVMTFGDAWQVARVFGDGFEKSFDPVEAIIAVLHGELPFLRYRCAVR